MPELPEVETIARQLREMVIGRRIAIFMMSAAVPWIGMLMAIRSAALRTAEFRLVMSAI